MLYCALNKCTSSREVVSGMKACHNKWKHLGISKAPGKSTLCDDNIKRSFEIFARIYELLHKHYRHFLPDSRINVRQKLFIADSSTITLFQEILKATHRSKGKGKSKGGIKVYTLMSSAEDVSVKISFTAACASDMPFLKEINLDKGSFIVFEGYVDYNEYKRMGERGVFFVTRQRSGASYSEISSSFISHELANKGILSDKIIVFR